MQASSLAINSVWQDFVVWSGKSILGPMQILISAPSALFFAALTAMLLRHPDVPFYEIDRIAFAVLIAGACTRAVMLRHRMLIVERASWPMMGLIVMALLSLVGQPFDHETWSLLAAKFVVPFGLFHLAASVFDEEPRFRHFEIFSLVVLAYLSFTAIAFLVGARSLIFPHFILDESLGFHKDRARGPLLNAVANGVSLNVLALLVVHAYRRGSLRGGKVAMVLASVPIAILATMTRAVWLAFAGSVIALVFWSKNRALRRACIALIVVSVPVMAILLTTTKLGEKLTDRVEERGPIDYRAAMYAGGWEMFLQRPWTGWGFHQMPAELPKHVSGYDEKVLYPHNTYLELTVEQGVLGLALYLWLMWEMWRLGKAPVPPGEKGGFLDRNFHRLWPILLGVYWVNAAVVAMNYQFVNGLVYTMAGMLAAQRRRSEALHLC